jgi:hypothetical protein
VRRNLSLEINESKLLFQRQTPTAGMRIVGKGRSGWGTVLTLESGALDALGVMSWTTLRTMTFNRDGDLIETGTFGRASEDPAAEALLLVLIDNEQLQERSDRLRATETEQGQL